jgi:hypothetical protein
MWQLIQSRFPCNGNHVKLWTKPDLQLTIIVMLCKLEHLDESLLTRDKTNSRSNTTTMMCLDIYKKL